MDARERERERPPKNRRQRHALKKRCFGRTGHLCVKVLYCMSQLPHPVPIASLKLLKLCLKLNATLNFFQVFA